MSAAQVQTFLNQRVPRCTIGDPGKPAGGTYYFPGGGSTKLATKCLKDAVLPSRSMASNPYCSSYVGSKGESAATIIQKVGQACGISQRVLLVMLEKEQSLVQDDFPAQHQFDRAMGYACPDSGPGGSANCDTQYYGFFNQVYYSAWQYKVYRAFPDSYRYKPFQNNTIQWHPNLGCGTSNVYIENRATASLYIYTPYRPNQAALNAGWGTGDACSSYGNRNFYNFYNTWFGSPEIEIGTPFRTLYQQLQGTVNAMGEPTGNVVQYSTTSAGQTFANGTMYWSQATGASAVLAGPIRDYYWANGSWKGKLGFPVGATSHYSNGGRGQAFANGSIYYHSATGASLVQGAIRTEFIRNGSVRGHLGYPIGQASVYASGGTGQAFQNGSIYGAAGSAAYAVYGSYRTAYLAAGSHRGRLGFPISAVAVYASGGEGQAFEGGSMYRAPGGTAYEVSGSFRTAYLAAGSHRGRLGFPISAATPGANGASNQVFEHGSIRVDAHGTATVEYADAARALPNAVGRPETDARTDEPEAEPNTDPGDEAPSPEQPDDGAEEGTLDPSIPSGDGAVETPGAEGAPEPENASLGAGAPAAN